MSTMYSTCMNVLPRSEIVKPEDAVPYERKRFDGRQSDNQKRTTKWSRVITKKCQKASQIRRHSWNLFVENDVSGERGKPPTLFLHAE
jgi:hypothetical protein